MSIKNSPHGERRAVIEGVVERAAISVVGTYQTAGPLGVIEPLDSRLKADFFILPRIPRRIVWASTRVMPLSRAF